MKNTTKMKTKRIRESLWEGGEGSEHHAQPLGAKKKHINLFRKSQRVFQNKNKNKRAQVNQPKGDKHCTEPQGTNSKLKTST